MHKSYYILSKFAIFFNKIKYILTINCLNPKFTAIFSVWDVCWTTVVPAAFFVV